MLSVVCALRNGWGNNWNGVFSRQKYIVFRMYNIIICFWRDHIQKVCFWSGLLITHPQRAISTYPSGSIGHYQIFSPVGRDMQENVPANDEWPETMGHYPFVEPMKRMSKREIKNGMGQQLDFFRLTSPKNPTRLSHFVREFIAYIS